MSENRIRVINVFKAVVREIKQGCEIMIKEIRQADVAVIMIKL